MIEEDIKSNRRKIFAGRIVFLLYVAVYSCAIFIPLALVFVKAAGTFGLVAILVSLALWLSLLILVLFYNGEIVRRATSAKPLEDGLYPRLGSAAEDMAIVSGQEVPRLMLVSDKAANAFSMVSFRQRRPLVFCTEGMGRRLDVDETRAVMAHEMAHLKNGDTEIGSMILPLKALVPSLYRPYLELSGLTVKRKNLMAWIALGLFLALPIGVLVYVIYQAMVPVVTNEVLDIILLALVLPFISLYLLGTLVSLYWFFTLGKREYLADETAVEWTSYPEGMIDALRKTGERAPGSSLAFLDNTCFAPPIGVRGLLDYQPSLMERIDNLRREARLPPE